jgi:hypothetical protein
VQRLPERPTLSNTPDPHEPGPTPPNGPGGQQPTSQPYGQQPYTQQPTGQQPYTRPRFGRNTLPPTPFGLPGQPPAKSRKGLWIVLGIVGGVLLLVAVGVTLLVNLVGGATRHASDLADDFTRLVISGETNKAYNDFMDPALKQRLSLEDFASGVRSLNLDPSCTTSYDDLKVSAQNGTNIADVAGLIQCSGRDIELVYRFAGTDELKMVTIRLRPKT